MHAYQKTGAVLLALVIVQAASCGKPARIMAPRAVRGVLDLRGWDFSGGAVNLDGEWEFYWKRLPEGADFAAGAQARPDGYMSLPSAWNGRRVAHETLAGNGYATFRLTVLTDAHGRPMAFRIMDMRTAYRLFANGRAIASNGTVGTSRAASVPQYLPVVADYTPVTDRVDLVLQVSNFHHARGGAFHSIEFGEKRAVHAIRDMNLSFQIFLLGSLLIMALYHLGLFLLRRNDRSPLYLAAFCLLIALRPLVTGEYFLIQMAPETGWELMLKLEYMTLYMGLPAFAMFINSLFPREFPKYILRPIQVLGGIFSFAVLVTPATIYSRTVQAYEIITLLASVFTIYAIVLAAIRRREGARIFIVGTFVLFVAVANEILFDNMLVNTGNFFPFGLFFFVLSQAFLLSHRFSKAYINIESLSGELEETNRRLVAIDRMKDEFLANTSHELRTPLHGIIGIAESLVDGAAGPLPGRAAANLSMIIASGRRLSGLINDILDFSKLRNREITLGLTLVDIRTMADMAIEITSHLKGDRPVTVTNTIPRDLPLVPGDENRIQQILINLIGNAVKFTDEGSVEVSARVIEGNGEGPSLEVVVADTGIGIPRDKLDTVFEPFRQADGSISRIYGGTGIGLSITRDLVLLHGGSIEAESEPGSGSTFRFRLPLRRDGIAVDIDAAGPAAARAKAEPGSLPPPCADEPAGAAGMPSVERRVILAVDDDPVNLQVIENQLSVHGYSVVTSTSGSDALARIGSGLRPDLVLLDVMMPRMSGIEVSRLLRKQFSLLELPIMMLTAKGRVADIAAGLDAGANDYLPKPFDRVEMLARVRTLVGLKTSVEESRKLYAIGQDLEVARKIQMSTIPRSVPRVPGLVITTRYLPMDQIGGDFYDFHDMGGGRVGILIADVSGHGVPAALIASMVKIAFYTLRGMADRPAELLMEMNRILTHATEHQYATAGYAVIDRGAMTLRYARAGHEPLLLFRRRSGEIIELTPPGKIIGLGRENPCDCAETALEPGDRVILYTDGITEVSNRAREMFDIWFLRDVIARTQDRPAEEFIDHLTALLRQWQESDESFEDDATIVVVDVG